MDSYDVVVLGTGAAGLTAAISAHAHGAASVGVFERDDRVGGTSAWSGGMLWVPCHPHLADVGVTDSREQALTYLDSLSNGMMDPDMVATYVDEGAEMVRFLEADSPVRFRVVADFPDYHPEHPGGKPGGGRSLECPLFPFDELGAWAGKVSTGRQMAANASGLNLAISETPLGHAAPQGVDGAELARRRERDERGAGQALVGRLLRGCLDRGIEPQTSHRALELVTDEGRVTGVRFETPDGPRTVTARVGVVLATGGFEWDPELVRSFLRGPLQRPVSVPTNTGDGLRMAMRLGAGLGNRREAWWTATIDVPDADGDTIPWMINAERTRPRTIMVNRHGERFANESANYNAFGAAFHTIDLRTYDDRNLPAWMVFDHGYAQRYGLAGWRGEGEVPRWLTSADSLAELAAAIGVPADRLEATVSRFNGHVAAGDDPDFGRGRSAHDQWWGDPTLTGSVSASLGPLDTAPYYAVEVHIGALGTKGGPRTTRDAQVVDVDGVPMPGLYAAGNTMASVMGMTYGGAGGTLGPAIVFGYLAGRHVGRAVGEASVTASHLDAPVGAGSQTR